jgi:UDP-N-acetylglucosamine--N-acetylmuramyl-(pentapeptide) pyrophosphoryl-undecaprenol N-acetylglucosamine transferase
MKTIVFAGGGTGGHIYPGLAVADELRILYPDIRIVWIGCSKGMDRNLVETAIGPKGNKSADVFKGIPSGKLRRYFSWKNFVDVFKILAGFFASFFILLKEKPSVLFSKGGFVSVPPCIAAKLLGIPVYTHECDYSPGLATRINAKSANRILVSFSETKKFFSEEKQKNVTITGNPIRPVFYTADSLIGRQFLGLKKDEELPVLLILGGSSGARQVNQLVLDNLEWLCEHFVVVHQTGKGENYDNAVQYKEKLGSKSDNYKPYAFIYSEMPHVIAASDVVLSRSGSNSLWECAVEGKPLILIPLCGSGTRGDQVENAEFFRKQNAAFVMNGDEANSENLKKYLLQMTDEEIRKSYGNASKNIAGNLKPAIVIAAILKEEVLVK